MTMRMASRLPSPKVLAPIGTALSAFAAQWITNATIDRPAASTLAVALIGALFAYLAPPGDVVPTRDPPIPDSPREGT
jgi:hypothetical protein